MKNQIESHSVTPKIDPQDKFWFTHSSFRSQINHLLELDVEQNRLWTLAESINQEAEALKLPQFEKYNRVIDTTDIIEKYHQSEAVRKSSQNLRNAKVDLMLPVAGRANSGKVNAYEHFILSTGMSMLRQNPSYIIQDNVLAVLLARSKDKHMDERAVASSVISQNLKEYENLCQEDPVRYPPLPISALSYAIKEGVYDIYGATGTMDVLIRRLIGFYAPTIRKYAYAAISPKNRMNRAYIHDLLSICASGEHPEWKGERFLNKIAEHTEHPYTDEEFKRESSIRQEQAFSLSQAVFDRFPFVIASGVTGSVARKDMQGFNPTKSDVDIVVYTDEISQADLRELSTFTFDQASSLGISVCPGTVFGDPLMLRQIENWQFNNPESIAIFLRSARTPGDTMFDQMAIMAANHYYAKIPNIREPHGIYQRQIHEPLTSLYENFVLPLTAQTRKLFADLDSH